jgi:hypothetical protein
MKVKVLRLAFFLTAYSIFAQRQATVGIMPFEAFGAGVSAVDAVEATRLVVDELNSWEFMTILTGSQAQSAEYLVSGRIAMQNNQIVLTASTTDTRSGKVLNESKGQAASLAALSIESFCAQITESVPYPNYILGKWQSVINMIDGPIISIIEFRSDRTVLVHQYDTWEHNGTKSLKCQAIGSGTYTYAGYRRRTLAVDGRSIQADVTLGINFNLEDALPKYVNLIVTSMRLLFDGSRTSFEVTLGGIPCGDNYSGHSVYPGENVFYTKFSKIQ